MKAAERDETTRTYIPLALSFSHPCLRPAISTTCARILASASNLMAAGISTRSRKACRY